MTQSTPDPSQSFEGVLEDAIEVAAYNLKTSPDEIFDKGVKANAKQAITQAVKQLVREAKPEVPDFTRLETTEYTKGHYPGFKAGVDLTKAALLKALGGSDE